MSKLDLVFDLETVPVPPTAATLEKMRNELFAASINWQPPGNVKKPEAIEAKRQEFEAKLQADAANLEAKYYEENCFNLPLLDIVSWCLVVCKDGQIQDVYSDARREAVFTFAEAWNNLDMKLSPRLIGFNSKNFDIPVLLINLMRHSLALKPRIGNAFDSQLDLRAAMCGFNGKGTLKTIVNSFEIDTFDNGEDGSMVLPLTLAGNWGKIEEYNRKDTISTAQLFLRLSRVLGI